MSAAPVPVPRGAQAARHRCPLCGGTFAQEQHCSICPMTDYCHTLCCPNCGYTFVERSSVIDGTRRIAGWLRRAIGRRSGGDHG